MKRIAVIDLGTNVFNLIVAEAGAESGLKVLETFKYPSRIGAAGLADGIIKPAAFATASEALSKIMEIVERCNKPGDGDAVKVYAFATSAIRDAKNGRQLSEYLSRKFGIEIKVISGDEEAQFIFRGVKKSIPQLMDNCGNFLFLDIGGGSDEFIITDGNKILWEHSFPLGMARLREKFNYIEPIADGVIEEFTDFCLERLQPLWEQLKKYKPNILVGSSGTFDTFKDLVYDCGFPERPSIELPLDAMEKLHFRLLKTVKEERMQMRGMTSIRENYIVMGSIFTRIVLKEMKQTSWNVHLWQSSYSLREGALLFVADNIS